MPSRLSAPMTLARATRETTAVAPASALLDDLLRTSLVLQEDWQLLPDQTRKDLLTAPDRAALLAGLVEHGLLTDYPSARIHSGKTFGLILGNYRVLDRLGAGGMGVVFRAEHRRLRRLAAVKVLTASLVDSELVRFRFDSEMRAVAQLQHPNIVAAIDAGEEVSTDGDSGSLHYFVMELVPGQNLEKYVQTAGALPVVQACDVAYQIASALAEAHKHQLIHRDLKPSNVQRTPEGRVKLLDFGLAQHFHHRVTQPGTMLGTADYIAPEQAQDAAAVDGRADIYGLGGTLFWCLTGRTPFRAEDSTLEAVVRRHAQPPPSARRFRPDLPGELDALVARMMATRPADRFQTAQAVMSALLPFLQGELTDGLVLPPAQREANRTAAVPPEPPQPAQVFQVLLVDDEASMRKMCRFSLKAEDVECDDAADGAEALDMLANKPYDLVLLDVMMPGLSGLEVCRRLRDRAALDLPGAAPNLKVIMFSGNTPADEMAQALSTGADDFLTKPFTPGQLRARVRAALRLKSAQDRTELLNRHLLAVNQQLEHHLSARDVAVEQVRSALVLALTRLVEYRDIESAAHLRRMRQYCRLLAEEAARLPALAGRIDADFLETLDLGVPLHDVGKVGLPDHILHKPGKLDPDERVLMQTHTLLGAELLQAVAQEHGSALAFLDTATRIARHHHERWDGEGYPDRLAGEDIPLAARVVAVADVYDALRGHRVYKPALPHTTAARLMLGTVGQFDPALLKAFENCHPHFERTFREMTG